MKKFLSLLLASMLCCAVFASCGKEEQQAEPSVEPSVEVEASPSPTPEPRTEVGIPEELKFCDEPLYYGMTIEEIREIFGQEDETDDGPFFSGSGVIGTRNHYIYYLECMGKQAKVSFRLFNYEGLVMDIPYGLDQVDIQWMDIPENEQAAFMNEDLRTIIENLYGSPDSEQEEITSSFRLRWEAHVGEHDRVSIKAVPKELFSETHYPKIEFQYYFAEYWDTFALGDEAKLYQESGKQGLTLDNLNRLKEGMSYSQAEVLLGTDSEITERLTTEGSTYLTVVWEDEQKGAYLELKLCDGVISSIYSKGIE